MNLNESTKHFKVAVAIPVYKHASELSIYELHSLRQLKVILRKRDIYLIHPKHIFIKPFTDLFEPLVVHTQIIDDKFFGSMVRGSIFGISMELYSLFVNYDFLLVHHLDAFVFSDQLDYWCNQQYDYIGAPWVKTSFFSNRIQFKGVGNGGLSLRKVKSFNLIANDRRFVNLTMKAGFLYKYLDTRYETNLFLSYLLKIVKSITARFVVHEDVFWGAIVPKRRPWFKVAPANLAIKFSFENQPRALYELNNFELPFGCHGFERYEPEFWRMFINSSKK